MPRPWRVGLLPSGLSLLEHEVPGQGLMFLLWSSGKGHTLIPCQLNKVLLFMLPNKKGGTQMFSLRKNFRPQEEMAAFQASKIK